MSDDWIGVASRRSLWRAFPRSPPGAKAGRCADSPTAHRGETPTPASPHQWPGPRRAAEVWVLERSKIVGKLRSASLAIPDSNRALWASPSYSLAQQKSSSNDTTSSPWRCDMDNWNPKPLPRWLVSAWHRRHLVAMSLYSPSSRVEGNPTTAILAHSIRRTMSP